MKKLLFLLLVLGVIALVGCAPAQPGTSREGALAGKAVDLGCDTQSVISCEDLGSGKVKVQYDSNTLPRELGPSCNTDEFGNPVAVQFLCANTKAGQAVSACSQQCVEGEACQSGACVIEPVGSTTTESAGACFGLCDTLLVGETRDYFGTTVTLNFVGLNEGNIHARFTVNGELTPSLFEGETYDFPSGGSISVPEITFQDYAGGIHSAGFCLNP